jgi:hypothetical protein
MPGLPQICGVDVTFQDRSASQHLHRAFVTTYDGIERVVVRMLLIDTAVWDHTLPSAMILLASSHLPIVLRRREAKKDD